MIEMNKRMFEVSMGDSSEEYIRKASIALAVIGFFSHISVWGLYSTCLLYTSPSPRDLG